MNLPTADEVAGILCFIVIILLIYAHTLRLDLRAAKMERDHCFIRLRALIEDRDRQERD